MENLQTSLEIIAPDLFKNELGGDTCLVEVQSGWSSILTLLVQLISEYVDNSKSADDRQYLYFSQIKEKNGKNEQIKRQAKN